MPKAQEQELQKKNRIGAFPIKNTGLELVIGNVIYYILGQIVILMFAQRKLNVSIGFFLGVVISLIMIIHMTISIEQAMCFNESGADRHVKKTTAIRMGLCGIVLIIIGLTHIGNIVATLFGVMALKVSAYIQPLTHKVLARKSTEKGR